MITISETLDKETKVKITEIFSKHKLSVANIREINRNLENKTIVRYCLNSTKECYYFQWIQNTP